MNRAVGVLMRACDVPENSDVTKLKGKKIYKITKELRIFYGVGVPVQVIPAEEGVLFLANGKDTTAIPAESLVLWRPDSDEDVVAYLTEDECPQ